MKILESKLSMARMAATLAFARNAIANPSMFGWKLPSFKLPGKTYPHHSSGECQRRFKQRQHHIQVRHDLLNKKQSLS